MTLNEEIMLLLDGVLGSDEEAELLHRLSVSPERRAVLHSYIRQRNLVARDLSSIRVPYTVEQSLWERLGMLMPVAEVAEPTTPVAVAASAGILSHLLHPMVYGVAVITTALGVWLGFTLSNRSGIAPQPEIASSQSLHDTFSPAQRTIEPSQRITAGSQSYTASRAAQYDNALRSTIDELSRTNLLAMPTLQHAFTPAEMSALFLEHVHDRTDAILASAEPQQDTRSGSTDISANSSGIDGDIAAVEPNSVALNTSHRHSPIRGIATFQDEHEKTLLQRFEFAVIEGFGRQFPNSTATNVSLPIVTNSALGIYFQVLSHSSLIWAGVNGGTANVTRKHLVTRAGDAVDPLQQQLSAELTHVQTNWAGALLQLRLPFVANADLMMTGGYGIAGSSSLAMAEVGLHIDATRDVGFTTSLRGVRMQYDLSAERDATVSATHGPLVIPHGVADAQPSYNLELSTGLFFHF